MAKQSRFQVVKAEKRQQKLKIGLEGFSGSGKTYTGLLIATGLAEKTGDDICVIDTENGSASLYADEFDFKTIPFEPPYSPEAYIEAIEVAENLGFGIIMIDSISHEWMGKGGVLELLDNMGGKATAWKELTPRHNKLVDKLLHMKAHLIVTLRSKTEYDFSPNAQGKVQVTKLGTKAIQRDGLDYEMTTVLTMNQSNLATASKDRTKLFAGKSFVPTKETGYEIYHWLTSGAEDIPTDEDKAEYLELIKTLPESRQTDAKSAAETMTGTEMRSTISKLKTRQLAQSA